MFLKTTIGYQSAIIGYEPDPTKAKVVYDAKVMEVAYDEEIDDGVTQKYLVHFQGWNSSW